MYENYWTLLEKAFESGGGKIPPKVWEYLVEKADDLGIPEDEFWFMCDTLHHKYLKARRREEEARRREEERREEEMALLRAMSKRVGKDDDDEDDDDLDSFIDELLSQSDNSDENIKRFEDSLFFRQFLISYRRGIFDEEMLSDELDMLLDRGARMGLDYRTVKQIINKYIPGQFPDL